jgi:hypothetical protein
MSGKHNPLELAPKDATESQKKRWKRLARRAGSSWRAAVELKCLDCCAWYRKEAKECQINTCALWQMNRKIFAADEVKNEGCQVQP